MYKTVVTSDRYYDKTVKLHKGYKEYMRIPAMFKFFISGNIVFIGTGAALGLLIAAPFWWLISGIVLITFMTGMITDVNNLRFKPYRTHRSDEHVGATKGVQYRVLAQLHNTMQYEEVDNFSNRQDLAGEVFNLVKVHRVDKSIVSEDDLVKAEKKLLIIEDEALRQHKEIKIAGLHAETPALDLAADVVRKTD